jgi:hypothetical protein
MQKYYFSKCNLLFYVLLTVHLGIILANNQLHTHFFFMYVYSRSPHVSGSHVPIIRRINCINATCGTCHSVQMTCTTCRIDTINSPDNGHMAVRNMWRTGINIHEKEMCVKLVICQDCNLVLFMGGEENGQNSMQHVTCHILFWARGDQLTCFKYCNNNQ